MTDITVTIPSSLRADVNEGLLVRTAAILRQAALAQRSINETAEVDPLFAQTFGLSANGDAADLEALAQFWLEAERLRTLVVQGKAVEIKREDFDAELIVSLRDLRAEERKRAEESAGRYADNEVV